VASLLERAKLLVEDLLLLSGVESLFDLELRRSGIGRSELTR